jgi:hypothetical protein
LYYNSFLFPNVFFFENFPYCNSFLFTQKKQKSLKFFHIQNEMRSIFSAVKLSYDLYFKTTWWKFLSRVFVSLLKPKKNLTLLNSLKLHNNNTMTILGHEWDKEIRPPKYVSCCSSLIMKVKQPFKLFIHSFNSLSIHDHFFGLFDYYWPKP